MISNKLNAVSNQAIKKYQYPSNVIIVAYLKYMSDKDYNFNDSIESNILNVYGVDVSIFSDDVIEGFINKIGDERKERIFILKFKYHKTYRKIANDEALSLERVRQICLLCLNKIRKISTAYYKFKFIDQYIPQPPLSNDVDNINILCLDCRSNNGLYRSGITKISELSELFKSRRGIEKILKIRNIGCKSVRLIADKLSEKGLISPDSLNMAYNMTSNGIKKEKEK